jgi:hypothetical protein
MSWISSIRGAKTDSIMNRLDLAALQGFRLSFDNNRGGGKVTAFFTGSSGSPTQQLIPQGNGAFRKLNAIEMRDRLP